MTDRYIESEDLSIAWGQAIKLVNARGVKEVTPLIVSVTGFNDDGAPQEQAGIRLALDSSLKNTDRQSVETVASTIFPQSMWNPNSTRAELFERYNRILPRLRSASRKNQHGIYFERMINGGPEKHQNQLEFVISAYLSRDTVRRSMLQIGVFNPTLDITTSAQRGFPCLQHVTFAPTAEGLSVNAFYATQYMFERAYGNYLGLIRLGAFVAHEMGLKLGRVTCYTGIAISDGNKKDLAEVIASVDAALAAKGI